MRALVFAALVVAATVPAVAAKPPQLPPYPKALRCAALTEARSKLTEDSASFDEAVFWGLAASESARKLARISAAQFKKDQLDWGARALSQLKATDASALTELEACRKQVPPLKKDKLRRAR